MTLTDLVEACAIHHPTAIVLAPDDYSAALAFANRTMPGYDWHLSGGSLTYRGAPIVRSREWQRSYLIEDTPDGPMIHVIG